MSGGGARRIGGHTVEGEGADPRTHWLELGPDGRRDFG